MRRRLLLAAGLNTALAGRAVAQAPPPEPAGLWSGAMLGPTPATLAGATVLTTAAETQRFLAEHDALPLDVGPAPEKPAGLSKTVLWLPPPQQDIPGSVWLPAAGRAVLDPERAAAFLATVAGLTGHDHGRYIVVYCHPNCWSSWNAGKQLTLAGYSHVGWFPGGIEGWAAADLPMQRTPQTAY